MFDASGESDLTEVLQGEIEVGNVTSDIMDKYRALGISKYNWCMSADTSAYQDGVLLVDQSRGDASMKYGGLDVSNFIYDARPFCIKLLAQLKSIYNLCIKRRLSKYVGSC